MVPQEGLLRTETNDRVLVTAHTDRLTGYLLGEYLLFHAIDELLSCFNVFSRPGIVYTMIVILLCVSFC